MRAVRIVDRAIVVEDDLAKVADHYPARPLDVDDRARVAEALWIERDLPRIALQDVLPFALIVAS